MIRIPEGPLTPHGAYWLLKGRHPLMSLWSFDGNVEISLMGGKAIPDRMTPESVTLKKDGLKGLIAPWDTIDQKGASEDGVTFIDALQSPIEVEAKVIVRGRSPKHLRRLVRLVIDSIDKKQTSELSFIDQDTSRWWANVRWFKGPPDISKVGESCTQELTLVLRADNGFWRTFNHTDAFQFTYDSDIDTFDTDHPTDLGSGWKLYYYDGDGGGYIHSHDGSAVWVDDPEDPITTEGRSVMCLRAGFETDTDNQVVNVVHATPQEFSFPTSCFNDIWGRCSFNPDGTWKGDGIRIRYGAGILRLSRFNNFVETVMRQPLLNAMIIPPLWGEKFSLVCGYEGDPRIFKVLRNGVEILSYKESGTGSLLGAAYRGSGMGMRAGGALLTQATPGAYRKWSAGDNATVSQTGYLKRLNVGDQPMPDKYTFYGPGTFKVANGPGSTDMIEFGPLLPNQVVWIDTNPQKPRIKDLTSVPPTPQELNLFQEALKDLIDFASGNNVPPLLQEVESRFGIVPPQGNLYSLLKGRWGKGAAIPPKPVGKPAEPYFVKVSIDGGNADSKILVSGTPRRRYPL